MNSINNLSLLKIVIGIVCITALILSSIAFSKKCNNDKFSNVLNESECYNNSNINTEDDLNNCLNTVYNLKHNMNTQYWGQPGNRGLTKPSGTYSGSFGNPMVI